MILITGAGGKTGKALVKAFSKVESVCAFVRHEEQVPVLKSIGAEKVIVGDMRDEKAIRSAMQNVRAIYHICPNMNPDEVSIGKSMINAARQNGVEHFVYHSVLHPQIEEMPHHWRKMHVEEMLFESGIPFTILQPAPYMQNLLANWKNITEEGVFRVPYSIDARFSFVDLGDIAEAASIILKDSSHLNAIYELAGTNPLSYVEVAEVCSKVLGRSVRAEKEDIADWKLRARSDSAQDGKYMFETLVKMFEYYDRWGLMGNPNILKWLIKREPTSLEAFIRNTVKERNAAA